MRRHAGELGENGVEERRAVLGHVGGHSLQQEQHCFHRLGETEGGSEGGERGRVGGR